MGPSEGESGSKADTKAGIPERWLAKLAWREEIERKAAILFDAARQAEAA